MRINFTGGGGGTSDDEEEDEAIKEVTSRDGGSSWSTTFDSGGSGGSSTVNFTKSDDGGDDGSDDDGGGGGALDKIMRKAEETQESVEQTVDDTADDVRQTVEDAGAEASETVDDAAESATQGFLERSGIAGFHRSEQGRELRESFEESGEEGGVRGRLSQFDTATRAGLDFVLDNPEASGQDTVRGGLSAATGMSDEELAQAAQDVDEGVTESIDEAVEGTAADNKATDAVRWVGDAVIGDVVRAGVTASTGIDTEEGDTEGTVGAVDAFDLGVTVGTAGAGGAAVSGGRTAIKSSDDVGTIIARALGRGGDEAAAADDAAQAVDEGQGIVTDGGQIIDDAGQAGDNLPVPWQGGDEAIQTVDDVGTALDDATGASQQAVDDAINAVDDALRGGDEAAQAGDDAASGFRRRVLNQVDEGGALTDEAAQLADDAAAGSDEAARGVDDAARGSDEVARGVDEAVQGGEDAGRGLLNRWTAAGGILGGFLAGGAANELLGDDGTNLEGGGTIYKTADLRATERFPQGGELYRIEDAAGNTQGYGVLIEQRGTTLVMIDRTGDTFALEVSDQRAQAVEQARGRGRAELPAPAQANAGGGA